MKNADNTSRPDPLLDAYRQANEREGARPGANVRAAVLAHARVVAQSSPDAVAATGLSGLTDATRATPAANEQRPLWRLAAGVVIGLVGVWIFQLTRPAVAPSTTVASADVADVAPAAQADKARAAVPPVADVATAPAAVAAAEPPVAVAVGAAPIAKDSAQKPTNAARARPPEAGLPEQNLAMATAPLRKEKVDRPAVLTGATVAAAPAAAAAAAPASAAAAAAPASAAAAAAPASAAAADASTATLTEELVIASAELRKSAKVQSRAEASTAAPAMPASPPPAAAPNAFPAQASEAAIAAAPAPRPAAAGAAPSRADASGAIMARGVAEASGAASPGRLSETELAMFTAVRAGDVSALRLAITRGANVNSKDERGRTPLQIARERADPETIRALEAAGAR